MPCHRPVSESNSRLLRSDITVLDSFGATGAVPLARLKENETTPNQRTVPSIKSPWQWLLGVLGWREELLAGLTNANHKFLG